jgi:hypothetical protein
LIRRRTANALWPAFEHWPLIRDRPGARHCRASKIDIGSASGDIEFFTRSQTRNSWSSLFGSVIAKTSIAEPPNIALRRTPSASPPSPLRFGTSGGFPMSRTGALLTIALLVSLGCAGRRGPRVVATFPSTGLTTVVLRSSSAANASVQVVEPVSPIKISGVPSGGVKGYFPSDPNWKETPASKWGLAFVAQRFGAVLVISSKNEIGYIHHHYTLESVRVRVPIGVKVVREPRQLNGDGAPDLASP